MTGHKYFDSLIDVFPTLKTDIVEDDSIYFRMERFANYTNEQIKSKNLTELNRCFDFQESQLDTMDSDLENALLVSYCEALLLGEYANEMDVIVKLMPPKLKLKFMEYEVYYHNLFNSYSDK
ncbi:hypothetical protein E1176_02305 [Fulvivirga sp. RKSG066]|uniref:DUF7674 family protein n=1 Tax=Fulvivirga aurantia TaxID=2529383 RepID=UPI0012BC69C7|nr:hypothetical protein [Fulvivirga aurantia]MTI19846.1 hypothetical protein [Fulvivirga aurantia]